MVADPDQVESTGDADDNGDAPNGGFVARFRHFLPVKF